MTLSFSTHINKKPTFFVEKIWTGIWGKYTQVYWDYFADELCERNCAIHNSPTVFPKIHTIRADPKNRWKRGNKIHMVIHNRTPNRFQFAPVVQCVSIQKIEIVNDSEIELGKKVIIDGKHLTNCRQLALNDGFDTVEAFWDYFGEYFQGKIIHWTKLRY